MFRPTISKESLHRETNKNDNILVIFASNKNIVISSTILPYRPCTYKYTDKIKCHICKKHEKL
jgi:hypothetical protein